MCAVLVALLVVWIYLCPCKFVQIGYAYDECLGFVAIRTFGYGKNFREIVGQAIIVT